MNYLYALIAIGLLIGIHEAGHFLAAVVARVRVLTFSIGFGPVLFSHKSRNGTHFQVAAIPLGGYVRMRSTEDTDTPQSSENAPKRDAEKDSFEAASLPRRVGILLAGVAANLILAWLLLLFFLSLPFSTWGTRLDEPSAGSFAKHVGVMEGDRIIAVDGKPVYTAHGVKTQLQTKGEHTLILQRDDTTFTLTLTNPLGDDTPKYSVLLDNGLRIQESIPPIVGGLVKAGSAEAAGLPVNARILSLNNTPIHTFQALQTALSSLAPNAQVSLRVQLESGAVKSFTLPLQSGKIGVYPKVPKDTPNWIRYHLSPDRVLKASFQQLYAWFIGFFHAIASLVKNASLSGLAGPVGILQMGATHAKAGIGALAYFVGALSFQLALINLIPIPATDGGRLLITLFEAIRKKRLSKTTLHRLQVISFILILLLLGLGLFADILRIEGRQ